MSGEALADFMRRKHDPKWRPAPLPKARRSKLSEASFARLMAEQGAVRIS